MRILVTGAAGFIGSHLAERLADAGHQVRGVDSFAPFYDPRLKRDNAQRLTACGIDMQEGDLAADDLHPFLAGVDAVFHLAAQPGLSADTEPSTFTRNNVYATQRLVEACTKRSGLRALIYASSSSVYGADATIAEDGPLAPVSAYGRTKLEAERVIQGAAPAADWDACILRLFSVYGPRERPDKLIPTAIRCALSGEPFPLFRGSEHHRRSFTYVGDAVDGLVAALDSFPKCADEIINLGAPRSVSTMEVLDHVTDIVGQPLCIRREPARSGDQRRTEACIDKALRLLSVSPSTPLREGIAAEVDWIQREEAAASV